MNVEVEGSKRGSKRGWIRGSRGVGEDILDVIVWTVLLEGSSGGDCVVIELLVIGMIDGLLCKFLYIARGRFG